MDETRTTDPALAGAGDGRAPDSKTTPALTAADIVAFRAALTGLDRTASDGERVDQLRALEELKSAVCAAQARVAVDLDVSQREQQAATGVPARDRGKGVGAQVALARRESPHRGGQLLGFAKAVVLEMPCTFAALRDGLINEWRATILVRESACLTVADRRAFDAEIAGNPLVLSGLGDRSLLGHAKRVAARLDPASVVARARRAQSERCVTIRPAPDTMTYLTGLLPVTQGIGVFAALSRAADAARAQGDERSRGQIMADTLVERVTGQAQADAVPIEVQLVMTDRTLLAGDDEPATIPGYATVPAHLARQLVADRVGTSYDDAEESAAGDDPTLLWLRRLFTHPDTGQLVALDSRRRVAPKGLRRFIELRDGTCRTPWCDAPIRHADHVTPHADGGATSARNLQGLCETCNYTKQVPGWTARVVIDGGPPGQEHVVELNTPAGHTYWSTAPPLPGSSGARSPDASTSEDSVIERTVVAMLEAA